VPNVVIVNAVYPPEPVVSAQMGRDLAVHLASIGAQVTVICPQPTRPYGVQYRTQPKARVSEVTEEDGVRVVRV
jgi:hypothetical protein